MIDETVTFNVLSEPGAISKVDIAPLVGAAWHHSIKSFCNLSRDSMDYKIICQFYQSDKLFFYMVRFPENNSDVYIYIFFFLSQASLMIFPSSLPLVRYLEVWICMIRKGER